MLGILKIVTKEIMMLNLKFRLQDDDDPFIKGEFDVIKELLEKVS